MAYDEQSAALKISQLLQENGEQREQLESAQAMIAELRQRIEELERAAARQAAPFRREEKKKVPADQRKKPGRSRDRSVAQMLSPLPR